MKKLILSSFLLLGAFSYAQTYCVPTITYGCGDGDEIDNFSIPTASFNHLNTGCSSSGYEDFTSQSITMNAGVIYPFTITHGYDSQDVAMWIDLDNDGMFSSSEIVASGSSTIVGGAPTTSGSIIIPASASLGSHRMRVATVYDDVPDPCVNDGFGEYHDYTVNIIAAPNCLAPTGVSSSMVTAYGARVSWTPSISTVASGYEYYLSTSNVLPTSATVPTGTVPSSANYVDLASLTPASSYYVWVRSACSATDKSAWSVQGSFATLCAPVVPAYMNDFSNFPGACWSTAGGGDVTTGPTSATTYRWEDWGFMNSGYTGSAKINIYSYSASSAFSAWLISNDFNLSGGTYNVSFDYAFTDYAMSNFSGMGSDDEIKLLISTDGGTTWSTLHSWNAANPPSSGANVFSLDLVGYNSPTTKFAIYGYTGTVADYEDFDFFIDNFSVQNSTLSTTESSLAKKNPIKLYPNPFTEVIHLSDISKVKNISIVDGLGRVVRSIEKPVQKIQLGDLPAGIYLVVLNLQDGSKETIKTIKK